MGFLDKAKAAAEQAANRANETVADVQTKRELTKAYGELGEKAYGLADSGAITHPELTEHVARIRELQKKLEAEGGTESTNGTDVPATAAGAGTAAGSTPGTAASTPGTAGSTAGTAGSTAGTAGSTPGTAGSTAGTSGSTAGTAGEPTSAVEQPLSPGSGPGAA